MKRNRKKLVFVLFIMVLGAPLAISVVNSESLQGVSMLDIFKLLALGAIAGIVLTTLTFYMKKGKY